MNKKFQEMLKENPDSFDDMDCRPGPSKYPEADRDEVTPLHIRKLLRERASRPMDRWPKEKLEEVKSYLESKDPKTLTRDDHYLAAEYLFNRYLPVDSDITAGQWQEKKKELRAKIDWNIDNPDAPKEPVREDPEFGKWLKDNLTL